MTNTVDTPWQIQLILLDKYSWYFLTNTILQLRVLEHGTGLCNATSIKSAQVEARIPAKIKPPTSEASGIPTKFLGPYSGNPCVPKSNADLLTSSFRPCRCVIHMFQPVLKWSSDRVACFQLSREEALKRLNDQIWDDSALFSLSASVVTMGQPLIQQLWEKLKIAHSSINRSQGTTSMTKTVLQDKYKDVLKDKYKDKDKDNLRCPV